MAVVLADDSQDLVLSTAAVAELARMGVTDVTLVRGHGEIGLVLEGWALDPSAAPAAVAALLGPGARTRALHPVAHTAVSAAQPRGERE